jgi:hypothetical protein
MNPNENMISLKSLIWNDYIGLMSVLFPVVVFAMAGVTKIFGYFPALRPGRNPIGPEGVSVFLAIGVVSLIIGSLVLFLRYRQISWYFVHGKKIKGFVLNLWSYRGDRGRIYFQYEHEGKLYENSVAIHQSKKVKSLEPGSKVTVLINEKNPLKAILMDIYV